MFAYMFVYIPFCLSNNLVYYFLVTLIVVLRRVILPCSTYSLETVEPSTLWA